MPDKTILLVEDNPADVTLTLRAMKRANIATNIAGPGRRSLNMYLTSSLRRALLSYPRSDAVV